MTATSIYLAAVAIAAVYLEAYYRGVRHTLEAAERAQAAMPSLDQAHTATREAMRWQREMDAGRFFLGVLAGGLVLALSFLFG